MVSRNILGFSVTTGMSRIIECNGFYASIMKAEKKKKDNDGLPPGIPIPVLPVDALKTCPDFWIGGQGSYVCPVDSDWGLWFNFEMNNTSNTSVLTSVKGMNPITGQRINGLGLEKYQNKCPIHKVDFKHGRLCPKCGFKWPEQNFLSSPNPFYLDGFRSADGAVRQFFFTDEMAKSIPEKVIGKDDTVPAFGFCFFNLKGMDKNYEGGKRLKGKAAEKYFKESKQSISVAFGSSIHYGSACGETMDSFDMSDDDIVTTSAYYCSNASSLITPDGGSSESDGVEDHKGASINFLAESKSSGKFGVGMDSLEAKLTKSSLPIRNAVKVKSFGSPIKARKSAEVGIGAGSKIQQDLSGDKRPLEVWQEKPASVMRIYFVFQEQFEKYAGAGLHDLQGVENGFLEDLPMGVEK